MFKGEWGEWGGGGGGEYLQSKEKNIISAKILEINSIKVNR